MGTESSSFQIAQVLTEVTVLSLPLWLGAIKFLVGREDSDRFTDKQYSIIMSLLALSYLLLLACLVSAASYLTTEVNPEITFSIFFLESFVLLAGALGVYLINDATPDSHQNPVMKLLPFVLIFYVIVLVGVPLYGYLA